MATFTAIKKVELLGANNSGDPIRYACGTSSAINKYDLLTSFDARTASFAYLAGTGGGIGAPIGLAVEQQEATGQDSIAVFTNGIFEIRASGAIAMNQKVKLAGANEVMAFNAGDALASYNMCLGYAMETASDGETVNIRVLL